MKIVIYLYNGVTMLDAIGPYEVLRNLSDVEIQFVARKKGEIKPDSQLLHLNIKHRIKEVKTADILIIPGSTISFLKEAKDKKVLHWIRDIHESTRFTTSVCTGSIILAATGLLEEKKATSHWKTVELLEKYGAEPLRERIVEDGKIITAAGVSAGIDMALLLAGKIRREEEAKAAQLAIEYDPQPPFDSGNYLEADKEIIDIANERFVADAQKDLSLWQKVKNAKTLWKLK